MSTVFKKEMRLFFSYVRSYVLLGAMLFCTSLFFTIFNLIYANVSLAYTLVYTGYACVFAAPIFALWMFSREDRAAGELFLFSLPLSPWQICIGKFLALFAQCAIGCSPTLIFPLILEPHGDFGALAGYSHVLLFFVVLALLCAISLLLFSVIRNKVGAFFAALLCSVLSVGAGIIYDLLPATALCALIGTIALFALVALATFLISRRVISSIAVVAVGAAVSLLAYFAFPQKFGAVFSHLLSLISPFERINVAYFGLFDLAGAIFTLCFTVILLFVAALVWSSRQRMEDTVMRLSSSKPHKIFAGVIAAALLLNVAVAVLPSKMKRIASDSDGMYSISSDSVRFLGELGEDASDVDVYFITSDGRLDYQVYEFLERYVSINKNIKLHTVNAKEDDSEIRDYYGVVSNYSILVKSSKRARIIDYSEMFYFYNWDSENSIGLGKVYPAQYESYYAQYSMYFENIPTVFCFEGEALLTNAINYVTSPNVPTLYVLMGHGESELSMTAQTYINTYNCEIKYINISATKTVPDDCDMLMINAPQSDVLIDEAKIISEYLDRGGRMMVNKAYDLKLSNLDALLASYGVSQTDGLVYEGDDSRYLNQGQNVFPNYIIGTPLDHSITASLTADSYMMFLDAAHIEIASTLPDGVSVDPFFVTSEIAYRKSEQGEDGEAEKGTHTLGVAIEAQKAEGKSARIVFFACENVINDAATSLTSGGNLFYIKSAISWLTQKDEAIVAVNARLVSGTLTLNTSTLLFWSVLLVIIVPAAVVIVGCVNRYKRRVK